MRKFYENTISYRKNFMLKWGYNNTAWILSSYPQILKLFKKSMRNRGNSIKNLGSYVHRHKVKLRVMLYKDNQSKEILIKCKKWESSICLSNSVRKCKMKVLAIFKNGQMGNKNQKRESSFKHLITKKIKIIWITTISNNY